MQDKNKMDTARQMTIALAGLSNCTKRKVGAVIVDKYHNILAKASNYIPDGCNEFDEEGETSDDVVHAEIAAIQDLDKSQHKLVHKIYISHAPCSSCKVAIIGAGIEEFEVAEEFMKFDGDKIRYDLVDPIVIEAIAKVFTYGAKKYKPKNYLQATDKDRFIAALFRHIEAYRKGEMIDPESQLHHLDHALCNLAIIKELEEKEDVKQSHFNLVEHTNNCC